MKRLFFILPLFCGQKLYASDAPASKTAERPLINASVLTQHEKNLENERYELYEDLAPVVSALNNKEYCASISNERRQDLESQERSIMARINEITAKLTGRELNNCQ